MLVTLIANNWFINILAAFFISLLDTVAYTLLAAGYNIFYAVSQIDIFGTPGGESVYEEITTKIYTALSVVMVFVFAYYLIMMIVDPDGGKGKSTTALVKETIIAFITVIILPTVFSYMSLFQKHVIANNTIGNLILGGSGGSNGDFGDRVSLIVFTSFYHPQGTSYSDYFDNEGNLLDNALDVCTSGGANSNICEVWVEALQEWEADTAWTAVGPISTKSKLYDTTNDEGGMYYMWIITTVCGVVCAWFFFSYAIDVGTRAVKLGFLQLIAPVPVLLKIFPQGKKTFDAWFAEIKKSYLEIFLRLAIIFFIVKLCTMVPMFIDAVWNSGDGITGGFLTKALATVCLILGLLKFAKDAPQLFKTIFASGGGLFAGLDWKPGMKRRVSENEYAMKGLSMGAGAVGGLGTSVMAAREAYKRTKPEGDVDGLGLAYGAWSFARSIPRGVISGAKAGLKNTPTEFSAKNLAGSAGKGLAAGQASEVKRQNKVDQNGHWIPINFDENGDLKFDKFKKARSFGEDIVDGIKESKENMVSTLIGGKMNNAAVDTIKKATENMDAVIKLKDVSNIDNAMKKMEEDIRTKGFVKYGDQYYTLNGNSVDVGDGKSNVENHRARYGDKATNADGHYFNPATNSYDHNYNPNNDRTFSSKKMVNTAKLGDLKDLFNQQKNQELAKAINENYHEGASTYMANVAKQLSKELGNLGTENIAKIDGKIKKAGLRFRDSQNNEREVENISDFLAKMSNVKENITADDIKVLKDVKSTMSDISKNIVITQQAQAAGKQQEKKDSNSK